MTSIKYLLVVLALIFAVNANPSPTQCDTTKKMDLIFVMDGSGSINSQSFSNEKSFMASIITDNQVTNTRYGVIQFAGSTRTELNLNSGQTKAQAVATINAISQMRGITRTMDGVQKAIDMFNAQSSSDRTKLMILITDGVPVPDSAHPCDLADDLLALHIVSLVVLVGNFDKTKVTCIVPAHLQNDHVVEATDFSNNALDLIKPHIEIVLCETEPPRPTGGLVGGDPHYKSHDGLKFKYDGPCAYLLTSNVCPFSSNKNESENSFSVVAHHQQCFKRHKNIWCIGRLSFDFVWKKREQRMKIEMSPKRMNEVMVDGQIKTLPFYLIDENDEANTILLSIVKDPHVKNDRGSEYHSTMLKTNFGFNLEFSNRAVFGMAFLHAIAPKKMLTCGLLGNNNLKASDDLMLRNGTVLPLKFRENGNKKKILDRDLVSLFGDSWLVTSKDESLRCSLYPKESFSSKSKCTFNNDKVERHCQHVIGSYMKKLSGKQVEKCFGGNDWESRIDLNRIYDDCVVELCRCPHRDLHLCQPNSAIQLFQVVCEQNGVLLPQH